MKPVPLDVRDMKKNWDKMGKLDPLWAVLSDPDKKGNKWDVEEFFATGIVEIDAVMGEVARLGLKPGDTAALDFGCGVGRLTQSLARYFKNVTGVDISPSMIERARGLNRAGDKCTFVLNDAADLKRFSSASFDFVNSSITLQHIDPLFSKVYLAEFLRVLKPGGVLFFQLTSHRFSEGTPASAELVPRRRGLRAFISSLYWRFRELLHTFKLKLTYRLKIASNNPIIPMHGIGRDEVVRLIDANGGSVVEVADDRSAGPLWQSYRYIVVKNRT